MTRRERVLSSPEYWFQDAQLDLYKQVKDYMQKEKINKAQLAERLGVGKSYITQILNGGYNYSLKKLIEICLSIGVVPQINYTDIHDVIRNDAKRKALFQVEVQNFKGDAQVGNNPNMKVVKGDKFEEYNIFDQTRLDKIA